MRVFALIMGLWAAIAGPVSAEPPIVPAFRAAELVAVGHVSPRRPELGAGVGQGGCTGTLIAPDMVLTAAHCVASRVDAPQNLFITFGWSADGPPLWRGTASRILVYPDYQRDVFDLETLHLDAALVLLPRPVPAELVTPVPLAVGQPADSYENYGYLARAVTILRGSEGCNIAPLTDGLLWGFDCEVVSGFSGGPLIARTEEGPVVVAVAVAHAQGASTGIRSFAALPEPRLFPDGRYPD